MRKGEDNIKIDPKRIWCEGVDSIQLPHDGIGFRAVLYTILKLIFNCNI
jgi:hypothetical protein